MAEYKLIFPKEQKVDSVYRARALQLGGLTRLLMEDQNPVFGSESRISPELRIAHGANEPDSKLAFVLDGDTSDVIYGVRYKGDADVYRAAATQITIFGPRLNDRIIGTVYQELRGNTQPGVPWNEPRIEKISD